ncbi:hypothetical protein CDL15_Pgr008335 [Punica granatum]|uniref:Uncharacterized protein n=1 Tax=Punica granatum TaxID=22663 RepID=A0A218XTE4_PUNGR|nr:hypothetical protein CDL15_Pgr008335 [Punica granatum]
MNSATVPVFAVPRFVACPLPLITPLVPFDGSCLFLVVHVSGSPSAFISPVVIRDRSFDQVILVGIDGPKWGADSLPLFGCRLD